MGEVVSLSRVRARRGLGVRRTPPSRGLRSLSDDDLEDQIGVWLRLWHRVPYGSAYHAWITRIFYAVTMEYEDRTDAA
jgi:hypothetical protein